MGVLRGRTRHRPPGELCCVPHGLDLSLEQARTAAAVHEAGHSVAAFAVGIHVPALWIKVSEPRRCGVHEVFGANEAVDLAAADVRQAVTMLAAGERAEGHWLGTQGLWTEARAWAVEAGALNDQVQAGALLGALGLPMVYGAGPAEGLHDIDYCQLGLVAAALLAERWEDVLAVSEGLLDRGRLTGDEAAELAGSLNPAPGSPR